MPGSSPCASRRSLQSNLLHRAVTSTVRSSEAESGSWMFTSRVLVLAGDEPAGTRLKPNPQADQAHVDHEHDSAERRHQPTVLPVKDNTDLTECAIVLVVSEGSVAGELRELGLGKRATIPLGCDACPWCA